jgi:diguanylate cyclase (GGDEF)-like protein/PAS domain S-box-containing protein
LGPVDFVTPEGREQFLACFPLFKQTGVLEGLEFDLTSRQGVTRRVRLNATAIYDGMGRFLQSRSIMYDITDLHRAQQRLEALAAEQRAILDNEIVGMVKARGGHAVWRNRAVETMFGYSAGELQTHGSRLLYASDAEFQEVKQQAAAMLRTGRRFHTQVRLVRKDGSRLWVDLSASRVGGNTEVIWSFVDITPLVAREEQARFMAHRDVLTGLPNRRQFDTSAAEMLAEAQASGHTAALCFLDLDGFKPVNDEHGHAAGDVLLQEMARRMTQCLRGNDVVFRFGGDEFVLLLPHVKDDSTCSMVLARLLTAIEQEVTLPAGGKVRVTGSIGAALLGEAGDSLDELLHAADAAMYLAKQSAGSSLRFAARKPAPTRLAALT